MFFFSVYPGTIGLSDQQRKQFAEDAGKKGHSVKLCQNSKSTRDSNSSTQFSNLAIDVTINGYKAYGLIDAGSSASFVNEDTMCKPKCTCVKEKKYQWPRHLLSRLLNAITFGGEEALLDLGSVAAANNLLKEGIIEKSVSPWHAQVIVVTSKNQRLRMAVDYSQTINRFTEFDAFPLPHIDDIVNKVASYKIYSRIDLRSAYYQVPLRKERSKQVDNSIYSRMFLFLFGMEFRHFNE
ncbi:hypothetical protein PR048_010202 [Dryococelus australis]|uniref:Reverse transcriptase domain-containing protein n=1 Tax=Dryococelus australis TaxID=614101 RepID=A0ABQ9I424_9NEOP|nr:hypothetical protein PR048_010202 [Dryococelus australis]